MSLSQWEPGRHKANISDYKSRLAVLVLSKTCLCLTQLSLVSLGVNITQYTHYITQYTHYIHYTMRCLTLNLLLLTALSLCQEDQDITDTTEAM